MFATLARLEVLRFQLPIVAAVCTLFTHGAVADAVSFPAGSGFALPTTSQSVAAGDLDGDSDIDFVASPNFGSARYFLNNGTANPFSAPSLALDATRSSNEVIVADMNGDGRLDIVASSFNGRNSAPLISSG